SGRYFQEESSRRVTVLANQQDMAGGIHRHDGRGARVANQLQLADIAVGKPHPIHRQIDDPPLEDPTALQNFGIAHAHLLSMAAGAGVLFDARELAGCKFMAVDAGLARFVQMEGMAEFSPLDLEGPGANRGMARQAVDFGSGVMARLTPRGVETNDLVLGALLVRPVAALAA